MSVEKNHTDYLYVYGIIPKEELSKSVLPLIIGIDQQPSTAMKFNDIVAIATPVNPQKFSQQNIDSLSKNIDWLQENAIHHHSCIEELNRNFTILPMSFCTIFQNEQKLSNLLKERYDELFGKLQTLKGKEEWNLKVFCKLETAKHFVLENNPSIIELKDSLASMPKGKQFLMKKKIDLKIGEEIVKEFGKWQAEIQKYLTSFIEDSSLRSNWGKDVTGRADDMIINCDFFVEKKMEDEFISAIHECEKLFSKRGCTFQVTGPWPPYHFSKMGSDD
ncbi:GvpL/GvpF family gas vesicle protein [Mesobacillus selenatarsenatis]|uniref:Gas vesicle synthesis GvpLGvpF n=1 Tax=Mesobacillus selenatarsenatis (strain DSM 18680 / JCM 14380 / FERM P-15431 / SF-1) TaxID=1321606 RepID=A0A0A8X619_MESS1|nr:GvpL/GvpF family gas vesicle protein [Mesobacillus selenatarsenatis]GAM14472.1 gas vesicle synthesis GvpLGvpF [Mesobacillus selenatarsenatis SF-1]